MLVDTYLERVSPKGRRAMLSYEWVTKGDWLEQGLRGRDSGASSFRSGRTSGTAKWTWTTSATCRDPIGDRNHNLLVCSCFHPSCTLIDALEPMMIGQGKLNTNWGNATRHIATQRTPMSCIVSFFLCLFTVVKLHEWIQKQRSITE